MPTRDDQVRELRGGGHGARADACAAKRVARLSARGWRSPPPPRRERGAAAPEVPEHEATTTQGEEVVGEVGAKEDIEPSPESMEE